MDQFVVKTPNASSKASKHHCERQDKEVSARYISRERWHVVLLIMQHGDYHVRKFVVDKHLEALKTVLNRNCLIKE